MAKKSKYKDPPRYKVIEGYEDEFCNAYKETTKHITIQLIHKLALFTKNATHT